MPRISGASLAEHVAQQERAVFDAAIRLFVERGYAAVSIGDIAAEVGLARNSLYRYFPDKAAILLRWFQAEVPIQAARSAEILNGPGPLTDRLMSWVDTQIDYALEREHTLFESLAQASSSLPPEARAELSDNHDLLVAPLREVLAECGLDADRSAATIDLLWSAVMTQAQREARGTDRAAGRAVLASFCASVCPGAD